MAVDKQPEQGISVLDVAFKAVQATLATLAAYRAARSAFNSWRGIVAMVRGEGDEPS